MGEAYYPKPVRRCKLGITPPLFIRGLSSGQHFGTKHSGYFDLSDWTG
jgi:hypothetical protein